MPIAKEIKIATVAFLLAFLLFVLYWHASMESQPIPAETVAVTIPEGFNVYQIASTLQAAGIVPREEFLKEAIGEEGFLFPDTYEFFKDSKPKVIISKMKKILRERPLFLQMTLRSKKKTRAI